MAKETWSPKTEVKNSFVPIFQIQEEVESDPKEHQKFQMSEEDGRNVPSPPPVTTQGGRELMCVQRLSGLALRHHSTLTDRKSSLVGLWSFAGSFPSLMGTASGRHHETPYFKSM